MKILYIVIPLIQVQGCQWTFLDSSETRLNMNQKFKDHVKQMKNSSLTLHISSKFIERVIIIFFNLFMDHEFYREWKDEYNISLQKLNVILPKWGLVQETIGNNGIIYTHTVIQNCIRNYHVFVLSSSYLEYVVEKRQLIFNICFCN